MAANVLVVDQDANTVQTVACVLNRTRCDLHSSPPGTPLLRAIVRRPPDLVIAGIGADDRGWSFCRELLDLLDIPLFLLLTSDRQADRVRGLEMGAMDCVSVRACTPSELAARLRAALRRVPPARRTRTQASAFVDRDLAIDLQRQEVWLAGRLVALARTEFRVLACLARSAGDIVPYNRLLVEVWGPAHGRQPAALRPHIHSLRHKLEPDAARPQRIVNHRGKGYLLHITT